MKKAIIYMEVACGCCGGIINRDYHNSKLERMAIFMFVKILMLNIIACAMGTKNLLDEMR